MVYLLPCTAVVQRIEVQVVPWGVVDVQADVAVEVVRSEVIVQQQQEVFD